MPAPLGLVRVHQDEQTLTFQVVGWGKMKQSLPVRQYAEKALAGGTKTLRVDLRHCTYLDSTFLGTLLYLQRAVGRRADREFVLICPSSDCCQLFHQMGIENIFPTLTTEELDPAACIELTSECAEPTEFNRNVLQAHQELANLGGNSGETFREVARQLAKDMGKTD